MRDALILELNREAKRAGGKVTKRLRLVARKLVDRAEDGEVSAIKEIDRVDGRVPLAQHVSGPEGEPIDGFAELLKLIDGTSRGLPDPARVPTRDLDESAPIEMTSLTQEAALKSEATAVAPPAAARPVPEADAAPRMKSLLSSQPRTGQT
jgi:hypothetical protein